MLKENITQEEVDKTFEEVKAYWDQMLEESGMSEAMFIAIGDGSQILGQHAAIKEMIEAGGLTLPDLTDGVVTTVIEE